MRVAGTLSADDLAAMLAAAAEDHAIILTSRDAHRLATHVVEMLWLTGYTLVFEVPS